MSPEYCIIFLFAGLNAGGFLKTILIVPIFSSGCPHWLGYTLETVEKRDMEIFGVDRDVIYSKRRLKIQAAARSLLCYWVVCELGLTATELAKRLGLTQPTESYAVSRGEQIAKEGNCTLVK